MRIYTVTKGDHPIAVVRAESPADAIASALAVAEETAPADILEVREPSDAEMVGWIERRADYAVTQRTAA